MKNRRKKVKNPKNPFQVGFFHVFFWGWVFWLWFFGANPAILEYFVVLHLGHGADGLGGKAAHRLLHVVDGLADAGENVVHQPVVSAG